MAEIDALTALRLQLEWGIDEALDDAAIDRFAAAVPPPLPVPSPSGTPPRLVRAEPTAVAQAPGPERARAVAAAAADLAGLRAALAAFDGCALAATASHLVFAEGDPDRAARAGGVMVVGDHPGDEEDRAGVPFVGPAGQLLGRMFASIGLARADLYLTNVVPWRPPGGRVPAEAEVALCLPFLWRHVALAAPRRLVLLGTLATRAVLGGTTMPSRARGRWHAVEVAGLAAPVPALPMAHPLGLLKAPKGKREAWADLLRLRQAIDADRMQPGITRT